MRERCLSAMPLLRPNLLSARNSAPAFAGGIDVARFFARSMLLVAASKVRSGRRHGTVASCGRRDAKKGRATHTPGAHARRPKNKITQHGQNWSRPSSDMFRKLV
jgi:hypothetical protein